MVRVEPLAVARRISPRWAAPQPDGNRLCDSSRLVRSFCREKACLVGWGMCQEAIEDLCALSDERCWENGFGLLHVDLKISRVPGMLSWTLKDDQAHLDPVLEKRTVLNGSMWKPYRNLDCGGWQKLTRRGCEPSFDINERNVSHSLNSAGPSSSSPPSLPLDLRL